MQPGEMASIAQQIVPLARMGRAQEVASVALFLASEDVHHGCGTVRGWRAGRTLELCRCARTLIEIVLPFVVLAQLSVKAWVSPKI
jgi:NAD(P)-dependent dehydrogenase (short-subunit alcohol dehydrogenase family)